MSILTDLVNSKSDDQLANLGNISDRTKTAGSHLVTINRAYEVNAANYDAFKVEMTNELGESVEIMEFFGRPKDGSQEAIDKAAAATDRTTAAIARLSKAVGYKSLKQAIQGAQPGTDAKNNATTEFTALTNKKLIVNTFTQIEPNKEGDKAFPKQMVDTFKFLDKSGNDALGRDRKEVFEAEAKGRIEIAYNAKQNPACIQLLAQMKEQAMGVAPAATQPVTTPAQQQANVAAAANDI